MARQYKLARKMKKITLTAAARELGVTQPALSSWESERKAPSIEALIRMAKFYGVTTDFLLGLFQEADPRKDWLEPIDPSLIPVLHETPVFSPTRGWAFADAVTSELHFANGFYMKHQYFLRLVAGHLLTRLPANYILRMAKPCLLPI